MNRTTTMTSYEWLLLIFLSILWGGSFFFVGLAVDALPPLTIVTLRVALAAVALLLVVYLSGLHMPMSLKFWSAFLQLGILNNVIPFVLIVWGQTQIASGLASILNATTPMFTVIAAHFLTRDERLSPLKLLGVIFGIAGVVVMFGTGEIADGALEGGALGQLAVLGGALSYALAGIFGRRFKTMGIDPIVTATGQVSASTLILIPLALCFDKPLLLPVPEISVWLAIVGLALFSTALAYIIYFRILSRAGATNVLLVTLLIPVSAILLGTVFLGEQLEYNHLMGMSMIGLGLLTIDGRIFRFIFNKYCFGRFGVITLLRRSK